jgi:CRP-like cAMP-binding protein
MYAELIKLFNQIVSLDEDEELLIKESFQPRTLAKGDFFLKAGEINKHVGFIKNGLVRYFVHKNEEESTFLFTKENEFIADYQSFNKNTPTIQNIQAVEDCDLLVINYADVQHIFKNTKHGNLLGRIIIEHRFDVMVNHLLSIYLQNQEERYKHFIATYSDLAQRIPQYLIASYVGVKPESLSRIRKRLVKNIS